MLSLTVLVWGPDSAKHHLSRDQESHTHCLGGLSWLKLQSPHTLLLESVSGYFGKPNRGNNTCLLGSVYSFLYHRQIFAEFLFLLLTPRLWPYLDCWVPWPCTWDECQPKGWFLSVYMGCRPSSQSWSSQWAMRPWEPDFDFPELHLLEHDVGCKGICLIIARHRGDHTENTLLQSRHQIDHYYYYQHNMHLTQFYWKEGEKL